MYNVPFQSIFNNQYLPVSEPIQTNIELVPIYTTQPDTSNEPGVPSTTDASQSSRCNRFDDYHFKQMFLLAITMALFGCGFFDWFGSISPITDQYVLSFYIGQYSLYMTTNVLYLWMTYNQHENAEVCARTFICVSMSCLFALIVGVAILTAATLDQIGPGYFAVIALTSVYGFQLYCIQKLIKLRRS